MFGYIVVNKAELKIKEFDTYHSFYCGLCKSLKTTYGRAAQGALSFDMTFLSILLTSLYESEINLCHERCVVHPLHKHAKAENEWTQYCADMTIVLSYLKCQDDWKDEHRHRSHWMGMVLRNSYHNVKLQYHDKVMRIESALAENERLERLKSSDVDALAACSGRMMAEICTPREDEWSNVLREFGDYLGRYIYLMDAYDDLKQDLQQQRFNPFHKRCMEHNFEDWIKQALELMIANCARAFERLPLLEHEGILRNIIYSGVWANYELIKKKRSGETDA